MAILGKFDIPSQRLAQESRKWFSLGDVTLSRTAARRHRDYKTQFTVARGFDLLLLPNHNASKHARCRNFRS